MSNFELNTSPADEAYIEIRNSDAYKHFMQYGVSDEQQLVSELKVEIREVLLKMAVSVVLVLLVYSVGGYVVVSMFTPSANDLYLIVQCLVIAMFGVHYFTTIIRNCAVLSNVFSTLFGIAKAQTFRHLMVMVVGLDKAFLKHEVMQDIICDLNGAQVACLDLKNTTPEIVAYSGKYIATPERHFFTKKDSFWIEGREIGKTLTFTYPPGNIEFTYHSCQRGVNLSEIRTEIFNSSDMVGYLIQDPKTPGFGMAILYHRENPKS